MRSLRERNRHNAMRTTQRAALDLFEAQGFEQVTVAEIAEAVGMAASTIYRHFETKEAIVLWDEHDASLDAAFVGAFTRHPPLKAIRTVFVDELGPRYEDDLEFQLRRVQYIYATEAVHLAAGEAEGLAPDLAMTLAKATVAGAGALAETAEEDPTQLRVNVTSPNGTTQAALEVLMDEGSGFPMLVRRAVKAAADRSRELGK